MKKIGMILLLVLCACSENSGTSLNSKEKDKQIDEHGIYGDDNRLENYQASEALKTLAASTVAVVKSSSLVAASGGKFQLLGTTIGDAKHLCSTEPFREQTIGAFCSGSLVGPDLVMTAGHCITNVSDCKEARFVFDFAVKSPGVEKKIFTSDEVYACREIVYRELLATGSDFAIIRLDRKVTSRAPLKVRRSGVVQPGDPVFMIGHPAGLPQKIAGSAKVRSVQSESFNTNLDAFGGNSGSAVFNTNTREIEGILVRGDTDFTWQNSCTVSYRCTETGCRGEDVTRIDRVVKYIPGSSTPVQPPPANASVFPVTANLTINDYPSAGVQSTVSVNAVPAGKKVQVQIELTHTYRGDLLVELVSPSGKTIKLHNQTGGSLDHLNGTFGADLVSAESLTPFSQETRTGTWKLKVLDKASGDMGVLKRWALVFAN